MKSLNISPLIRLLHSLLHVLRSRLSLTSSLDIFLSESIAQIEAELSRLMQLVTQSVRARLWLLD